MSDRILVPTSLLLFTITVPLAAQDLVPAGSINTAASGADRVIAFQEEPGVRRQAEAMQRRFAMPN